jgi:hypothetical protein
MAVMSLAEMTDTSWRGRLKRVRRVILPVIATLALIGAFLTWGPIGLGNGPLSVRTNGLVGWTAPGPGPVAFHILVINSGHSPAVIDAVELAGGTSYPAPHELGLNVETSILCGPIGLARSDLRSFVMLGCADHDRGALIGRDIAPMWKGTLAAAEVAGPRPGTCWVMTKIIIHYRVGIRHYAATDPYPLAVCAKNASAQVTAAMSAAGISL